MGIDRNLTDVHHFLGQYEAELQAAERGRRLAPDIILHRYSEIRALIALGRIEEAMARLDEALLLSPHDNYTAAGQLAYEIGLELRAHGHLEEAANQFQFAIDWFRSPALEEWVRGQNRPERARQQMQARFGRALYEAGRYGEAYAHFEALERDDPGKHDVALGLIAARRGNRSEAERRISLLENSKSDPGASVRATIGQAGIAALLGDGPRAVAYLREWLRQGGAVHLLHDWTEFDALRDDPGFQALVRPKG